ncbi:MAG: DUF2236 domain-containing protein, partial [Pseudomonadales bacterium]|nr:DUF2236 domain-containing protein [Pseudomonadales bacterium]
EKPAKRALPWKIAKMNWFPTPLANKVFGSPLAPSQSEWLEITEGLYKGDPTMDKVVDWMFANGPGKSKKLFDTALEKGIEELDNPPMELVEFFRKIETPPDWLDRQQLDAAIQPSHLYGGVGFFVLRDMALMGGYAYFNTMNQTLANAGALHKDTALRIGETGQWLYDVTEPQGMTRFGPGFISTIRVRLIHALVRRHLQSKAGWDKQAWGIPINQVDMLSTYLAFGPVNLSGVRLLGAPVKRQESKAIMHMWRYIGWLMGVDPQWLAVNEGDGLRKLYHTFLTHRLPDEKIRLMGEALKNEPLNRPIPGLDKYPTLTKWVQNYQYHMHLSNSALILGLNKRRQLGIPWYILPWYPLLSAPLRFLWQTFVRSRSEHSYNAYLSKNRLKQKQQLDLYFGNREKRLIQPDQEHPAHIRPG